MHPIRPQRSSVKALQLGHSCLERSWTQHIIPRQLVLSSTSFLNPPCPCSSRHYLYNRRELASRTADPVIRPFKTLSTALDNSAVPLIFLATSHGNSSASKLERTTELVTLVLPEALLEQSYHGSSLSNSSYVSHPWFA
uniref:Uncharacterized protein n=1 Tax=Rhodosorus marinus TaxID=101924 RepID=A0A6T6P4A4_9RHOD